MGLNPFALPGPIYYHGDNRVFNRNPVDSTNPWSPPYRVMQQAVVESEKTKNASGSVGTSADTGITRKYAGGFLIADSGASNILNDGRILDPTINDNQLTSCGPSIKGLYGKARASFVPSPLNRNVSTVSVQRYADHSVITNFHMIGYDPLEPSLFAPISSDISVKIDTAYPVNPVATISGSHTCYPAHEVYVNGRLIWGYGPGASPAGVNGLGQFVGQNVLSAQDVDTHGFLAYLFFCLSGQSPNINFSNQMTLKP